MVCIEFMFYLTASCIVVTAVFLLCGPLTVCSSGVGDQCLNPINLQIGKSYNCNMLHIDALSRYK